ncbi:MAG: DnaJ domain-containing protein [Pseudomonadota bacterium]
MFRTTNVTGQKKTLYQILGVAPDASDIELQAAHETVSAKLHLHQERLGPDDFKLKLKVLTLAYKTLSTPSERGAYDARLAATAPPPVPVPAMALAPQEAGADALSLKAEAMALRAEAMHMRAEALSMRSGPPSTYRDRSLYAVQDASAFSGVAPAMRKILMGLGTLFAIAIVSQVLATMFYHRRAHVEAVAAEKASEQVLLQEYYQTHGVRPANKAELDLLEAENRRKENETRTAEREKTRLDQNARRFEEESRRRGEQASAALRYTELQAQERARREDDSKQMQQRNEQRVKDQQERTRLDRLKAEWNYELRR